MQQGTYTLKGNVSFQTQTFLILYNKFQISRSFIMTLTRCYIYVSKYLERYRSLPDELIFFPRFTGFDLKIIKVNCIMVLFEFSFNFCLNFNSLKILYGKKNLI